MRAQHACVVLGALALLAGVSAHCPNYCSGHGDCGSENACTCFNGWMSGDCSERSCPSGPSWADIAVGVDTAHQVAECSNRGICNRETGQCKCMNGYEGIACNRMQCPNACNSHGSCSSMLFTAANKDLGTGAAYAYTTNWDANMIYGCTCDPGWEGYDCSLQICPLGDDPLTPGVDSVQIFQCSNLAVSGSLGFYFQYKDVTSAFVSKNANLATVQAALSSLSTMNAPLVSFVSPLSGGVPIASTVCSQYVVVTVDFSQEFGEPQFILAVDGTGAVISSGLFQWVYSPSNTPNSLVALSNVVGVPALTVYPVEGTKENAPCSNRGYCNQWTGECTCYTGFESSNGALATGQRGDCGWASDPIASCPGTIECSGHGVCSGFPEYVCACDAGFTSGDCSQRTCPLGYAWFELPTAANVAHFDLVECSNKGICDRESGRCECQAMFEGDACERMVCPGETPCNGNGVCTTMYNLATFREVNGNLMPTSYGLIPNNPLTWDYKMVYGCACDEGWIGYDCSQRICPYGNDYTTYYIPATANTLSPVAKQAEIQALECVPSATAVTAYNNGAGTSYGFQISFRNYETAFIPGPTTMVSALEGILEALPSIAKVGVSVYNAMGLPASELTTPVCGVAGNVIYITFYNPSGDVPTMTVIPDNINNYSPGAGTLSIYSSVTGTSDDLECAGRGICDRRSGQCKCLLGFGSGDGAGNQGGLGECGFRLPYDPLFRERKDGRSMDKQLRGEYKEWQDRTKRRDSKEWEHRDREFNKDTLRQDSTRAAQRERERGWTPKGSFQWGPKDNSGGEGF